MLFNPLDPNEELTMGVLDMPLALVHLLGIVGDFVRQASHMLHVR
jgi:hypothetical protein